MSILDLIQVKGIIFAVNSQGSLLTWNFIEFLQNKQSIIKNNFQINIDDNNKKPIFKIYNYHNTIYTVSSQQISMLKIDDILHCINSRTKFSYEKIQKIKLEDISFEEDFINATAMSHQKGILYIGTAKGKLHYFDLNQNKKIKTLTINKQRSLQHPQFSNTQSTQCISDICISQQQNESYAIISTKNGRILIYNLQFGNLSIQIKLKRKINNIRKMVLIQEQGKLFTIHQNQVVEWNISLRIQLRSYKCVYSSSVCKLKNSGQILIGGLSNNVLIYKRDFNNESSSLNQDKNIQMEVSMRSVNVIKELISKDNLVIFGGGDNLIDVYKNGVRLTTLYAM